MTNNKPLGNMKIYESKEDGTMQLSVFFDYNKDQHHVVLKRGTPKNEVIAKLKLLIDSIENSE